MLQQKPQSEGKSTHKYFSWQYLTKDKVKWGKQILEVKRKPAWKKVQKEIEKARQTNTTQEA
jgi:hypothetical protein